MSIIPEVIGIYRAERDGETVIGTAREISNEIGLDQNYIRHLAKDPRKKTRGGWRISVQEAGTGYSPPMEYLAECDGEDPIIGPVSEIAALTGMPISTVRYLISTGEKSGIGWTVKALP